MAKKNISVQSSKTAGKRLTLAFYEQVKWPESYASLLLGIIVVFVLGMIIFSFVKGRKVGEIASDKTENISQTTTEEQKNSENTSLTYVVNQGDSLWTISEKYYKSGYNWIDIAKANNLVNPDAIEKGAKLIIPQVEAKNIEAKNQTNQEQDGQSLSKETEASSISGTSYTVKNGDDLWEIAVRAYGDGFAWVKIAKANNLSDPNIIHSGNNLTIPR